MSQQQPPQQSKGSKISNTEWGLVIGATILIDVSQIVLDFLLIGFLFNPIIDFLAGMSLAFYFWLRGVKMDWKKGGALSLTFLLETLGLGWLDSMPLWSLDVVVTMLWDKAEKKLPNLHI